ncbi:MAG TPA: hypothetical protein ENG87_03605 [Candidatus Pacearchaeota archaeon]|nr:hypothetical protein [Candidatus Pacearchaeota archaeon]
MRSILKVKKKDIQVKSNNCFTKKCFVPFKYFLTKSYNDNKDIGEFYACGTKAYSNCPHPKTKRDLNLLILVV